MRRRLLAVGGRSGIDPKQARATKGESGNMKMTSLATVGIVAMWLTAAGLLTFAPSGVTVLSRWGLFATIAAGTATVCHALRHVRRVILEVLTWERWMTNERETPPVNVRKIR